MALINNIYKNEKLSDVQFLLKKRTGDESKIPAHRQILASSSPVFEAMLFGDNWKEPSVEITDVCAEAFSEFLQFFYVVEVTLTTENIAEVLKLAGKYDVPKCTVVCERFLKRTVSSEVAFHYYELPLSFDLSKESVLI